MLTWDGAPERALKRVMGVPAQTAQGREVYVYPNPSRPDWPAADFIVGNPPFIGGKDLRSRLDEGEVEALWAVHPHINPSADFVMYWWDRAAELLVKPGSRLRRFGFVTTNSITQVFQRRVVENRLRGDKPISLVLAIPDHPWTKASADSAAVRIAITVAEAGERDGILRKVTGTADLDTDEPKVELSRQRGRINADLTIGADVGSTTALVANDGICSPGMKLHGSGFVVKEAQLAGLGVSFRPGLEHHIRDYRNGRDLASRSRAVKVIDLFGLGEREVRDRYPEVYQHLLETVRPVRQTAFNRSATKDAASYLATWWLFGKPRQELRPALQSLARYIVTVETTKHRVFQFLSGDILPDNMLVAIATDDAFHLGVLSSRSHVAWALSSGGHLGVGNDPRYSKFRCFDPFPFPIVTTRQRAAIADLAEELDALRKRVLAEHEDLTLTGLYNTLEDVRAGRELSRKAQDVKARGHVLIIKELHERIDAEVARAYGWPEQMDDQTLLQALVDLNKERSELERRGTFYWLRESYQVERLGPLAHRADRVKAIASEPSRRTLARMPDDMAGQTATILRLFPTGAAPVSAGEIAAGLEHGSRLRPVVDEVLGTLARQGEVDRLADGRYVRAAR